MLFHGIHKVIHGHDAIRGMLNGAGLPEFFWIGVPVGEVIAPILLILGILTVPSALLIAFTMLVSMPLAFGAKIFSLTEYGSWAVEVNVFFLVVSVAIALLGPGRFSLAKKKN